MPNITTNHAITYTNIFDGEVNTFFQTYICEQAFNIEGDHKLPMQRQIIDFFHKIERVFSNECKWDMRLEEITYVFGHAVVIGAYGGNRQGEMEEWNVALVVRASQRFQDIYNVARG